VKPHLESRLSRSSQRAKIANSNIQPEFHFNLDCAFVDNCQAVQVVKGVQTLVDAKKLATLGVDGIVLSNHGGRQLDRAPVPFHLLPRVVREVGSDLEVHIDTGIMNGADIVASIALGAKFTLIGRSYLYGLMAGGREGVDRTIQILSGQIARTMKLLGVRQLAELTPSHVTQLQRLTPIQKFTD
jgi:L-lactate dehydrogenase (cytochrome)